MGACVSAAPQCKNQCGRDSAELCRGYCKPCFDQFAANEPQPRSNAPVRPRSAARPSAPPRSLSIPGQSRDPPSSDDSSGSKQAAPMPTPMREPPAFPAEGGRGSMPPPSPPPAYREAQMVPGGPSIPQQQSMSPQQYSSQQYSSQQQAFVYPPASAPVASMHAPVMAPQNQQSAFSGGVVYSPPAYGSGVSGQPPPSPWAQNSPAVQMGPPVVQQPYQRAYQQPQPQQQQQQQQQSLPTANVSCPQCKRPLYIPPTQTAARCPNCNMAFTLPGAASPNRPVVLVANQPMHGGYYNNSSGFQGGMGASGGGWQGGMGGGGGSGIGMGGLALGVGAGMLASAALGGMFR